MRRIGTVLRLCDKCGGELRAPRPANPSLDRAKILPAETPDVGVYTCIVCGGSVTLTARRKSDFRGTASE